LAALNFSIGFEMNPSSANHWLFRATMLAIVGVIPVALIAFSAVYVSDVQKSGEPPMLGVLVIYCVPPLWLIALVLLGRAELELGLGEEPKGELEALLLKKQGGVLRDQPRCRQAYFVRAATQSTGPAPVEFDPMLDRLLAWQRRHRRGRKR
jgi:hypothetical protein